MAESSETSSPAVVLITGASRGIGRETALAFARQGWSVGLLARDAARLQDVAREVAASGGRAAVLVGDVADPATPDRVMDQTERELGPVDAVINNAGVVGPLGYSWTLDPAEVLRHVQINVAGAFAFTGAALARMVPRRRGIVVNISSGAAANVQERRAVYSAAKAAVDQFTRSVAAEAAPFGIRVYAVYPGIIDTDMQRELRDAPESVLGEELKAEFAARYAQGTVRQPSDAAHALLRVVTDPSVKPDSPVFRLNAYFPAS